MTIIEKLESIMDRTGTRKTDLSNRLGVSFATIAMRFRQKSITTDKLNEMLRVMDYKLVMMPTSEKNKDGWYEL